MVIINKECAAESTGHGSPTRPPSFMVDLCRAGGGEEMGGIRGVHHYMQRTALQGSPTTLTKILNTYLPGAKSREDVIHPFRKYFEEIEVGDSLLTHKRTVTEVDIVNFAGISGDYFYAHTDETSLEGSIWKKSCAWILLSFPQQQDCLLTRRKDLSLLIMDSTIFVSLQPVYVGDTIQVRLTCQRKTKKRNREGQIPQGVVEWYVEVTNQRGETVALETVLTLVACKEWI